jgi:hypothetical protein
MEMPAGLEYWTADEVAECLDYHKGLTEAEADALCRKLWGFLAEAKNATPLGGDGSNGTVETPDGRLSLDNDDKAGHWWARLNMRERAAIAAALSRCR